MLEPKNPNEIGDGSQGAKVDPKEQATDQSKPTGDTAEEGSASKDELDQ